MCILGGYSILKFMTKGELYDIALFFSNAFPLNSGFIWSWLRGGCEGLSRGFRGLTLTEPSLNPH